MIKDTRLWTIDELRRHFASINFPEYQREPNVWSRKAKQKLIDSIVRQFDIASIYIYEDDDGSLDCIDGRQRLNAIMSFLNENPEDEEDEGFGLHITNEIYPEDEPPFTSLEGKSYEEIVSMEGDGHPDAIELLRVLHEYQITIVKLSGAHLPEEFNLQFTRLNLGAIINSGEKLHAMVGEMRDICFGPMADNRFLEAINIPTRRYARQQVAAQILAQIFSKNGSGDWTRTRHYDLQRFFKDKNTLTEEERELVSAVCETMSLLGVAFSDPSVLRNRALSVSSVLLAWSQGVDTEADAQELAEFIEDFICRLLWQVGKGLDVDDEYRYLIAFQRHVTQASVEKYAVEGRASVLESQFERWKQTGMLDGDERYRGRTGLDPSEECQDR